MRLSLRLPVAAAALFSLLTTTHADSVDSLYQLAVKSDNASAVAASNELMLLLDADGVTDSLIRFATHCRHDERLKTIHLNMAAYYYGNTADMPSTLQAARQASAKGLLCRDTAAVTEALAYQAVAASRMGQIDVALEATREELRLDSLSGNIPNLARAYNTLAGLSLQAGSLEDAESYVLRAIDLERSLPDSSHLGVRYGLAAEIYAKRGRTPQALQFAQRAYELERTAGNEVKAARRLSQMADIYAASGDDVRAESFYLRAGDILRKADEQQSLTINLKQLGQLYLRRGNRSAALKVLEECEQRCRQKGFRYTLQQVCRLLAEAYAANNASKAVAYLTEALQLTDSIHSERAEQLSAELGRSQRELIRESVVDDEAGHSWHLYVLIGVLAAMAGIGGGWLLAEARLRRRERQGTTGKMAEASGTTAEATESGLTEENEHATATTAQETPRQKKENLEFLAKVAELYDQNLKNGRLSIDDLASELCMSRSQFTRRLTAASGMAASNFLNRIRLEKACRLLKGTEKPVSTIAYECGFDDTSYFSNLFKKQYKVTPMQFRIMPKTEE